MQFGARIWDGATYTRILVRRGAQIRANPRGRHRAVVCRSKDLNGCRFRRHRSSGTATREADLARPALLLGISLDLFPYARNPSSRDFGFSPRPVSLRQEDFPRPVPYARNPRPGTLLLRDFTTAGSAIPSQKYSFRAQTTGFHVNSVSLKYTSLNVRLNCSFTIQGLQCARALRSRARVKGPRP